MVVATRDVVGVTWLTPVLPSLGLCAFALFLAGLLWAAAHQESTRARAARFLTDIAWPAVAGNVIWAMATLLLTDNEKLSLCFFCRAASLFALAAYLVVGWSQTVQASSLSRNYLAFDFLHLATIVWVALAVQLQSSNLHIGLASLFVCLVVGHAVGAWRTGCWYANAMPSGLGLIVTAIWWGIGIYQETLGLAADGWWRDALPAAAMWSAFVAWVLIDRKH